MNDQIVTLDVRGDIREGREPFSRIMQAVGQLQSGQALRLIAPFQPVPIFAVLARQGFDHEARPLVDGDWEVRFTRLGSATDASANPGRHVEEVDRGIKIVEVDARGLEPPQPLVTILEKLTTLPEGTMLRAHTDRRPMHLYAQLADRGFTGESEDQSDGSFITDIRRS
jgi:uncharacterized protein (DUF2249 family)